MHCIPHLRGDGPTGRRQTNRGHGYSPPAWGWPVEAVKRLRLVTVFPTCVGMARVLHGSFFQLRGIPHLRGDGPKTKMTAEPPTQYSPPAWGWPVGSIQRESRIVVFPTCVGMARCNHCSQTRRLSIPHLRGDGPAVRSIRRQTFRYSPPAWGWPAKAFRLAGPSKVFPTCVGMARKKTTPSRFARSIPHLRGDGPSISPVPTFAPTYSPPAWGWPA